MQVQKTLRQFRHLGNATGNGHTGQRVGFDIFQCAADKIAHVDKLPLIQRV